MAPAPGFQSPRQWNARSWSPGRRDRWLCCLLTSETCECRGFCGTRSGGGPGQAGGPGGEGGAGGKRSGRSLVSTALTSTPHRRRPPKKNRRIPTIPAGYFDGRLVHVSAVDTGPRKSESGVLGGTAQRFRHRSAPAPCAGARWSWFDAGSAPSRPESVYSTRVGIHWPRVVRTARRPHLPEVPPTLLQ
mgnify:CR=1 FL=1